MNAVKTYKRHILKTGEVETCKFTEEHAREARNAFGATHTFDEQFGMSPIGALRLVNKWNHSTLYHYWIEEQM